MKVKAVQNGIWSGPELRKKKSFGMEPEQEQEAKLTEEAMLSELNSAVSGGHLTEAGDSLKSFHLMK